MTSKDSQRNQAPIRGGVVEKTLNEGLEFKEHMKGNPENEEAKVFAANFLTKPTVEAVKSSKIHLLKRKVSSGEGPKRKSKKSKMSQFTVGVEGVE
ncbi:hypothetical protein LIER_30299 [Lithospermum erythrorhizon]|uniref:Uncharacterized protein n=1 Tax=Lithospermum erythrorhizon TaxID=34254 RepID=A0AAV3RP15_LITER